MSLNLYIGSQGLGPISFDGSYVRPLKFEISQEGGVLEQRIFLRSDNPATEAFADGVIFAKDGVAPNQAFWVEFAADENGAAGVYMAELPFSISQGEELPIWIKLDVPSGQEQETKTDIRIATRYVRVAS